MTADEAQTYEEQLALACLLTDPRANRWELDGLAADLFVGPLTRQIAEALIAVRDSGRHVHWRRVRTELVRRHRLAAAGFIRDLRASIGTTCGLTQAVGYLTWAREQRRALVRRAA